MILNVLGYSFQLLPEKALYLPEQKILVVSDVHLGKITHFRKAGIALPAQAKMQSLEKLEKLTESLRPKQLILLGDFFHAEWNSDWEYISDKLKSWKIDEMILVGGNHDVLASSYYKEAGMTLKAELRIGDLLFTHEPEENVKPAICNIAGHIHPAVTIRGKARQHLRLACFVYSGQRLILPAFGAFTGKSTVIPKKNERIFVVGNNEIFDMPTIS